MIPIIFELRDYNDELAEERFERMLHSVPRKGEVIRHTSINYKVVDVVYDLNVGSLCPIIKVTARDHY